MLNICMNENTIKSVSVMMTAYAQYRLLCIDKSDNHIQK